MSGSNVQFFLDSSVVAENREHAQRIGSAMGKYQAAHSSTKSSFQDWQKARELASNIKSSSLASLGELLLRFEANMTAKGVTVYWAQDGESANRIILELLQRDQVSKVVKSKNMTSEETHLNDFLEANGVTAVETDLGEYVQQLRKEPPYHFVFPCMHLKRDEIAGLFRKELGVETEDSPEALTMVARETLRNDFLTAGAGITGANFIVANQGMISLTENEGNIRLTAALPKLMITLVGIEKIIEDVEDLALLWPMLGTAGTGQLLTGYNTLYSGSRQEGEPDGPDKWHVVLLDNGRSKILADPELRESLKCIRCGACLNVCPVYRHIGGLSYGSTYQGPIGSVVTPPMQGIGEWNHLSFASSLCGACTETCPVKINLHELLLVNRHKATFTVEKKKETVIARWVAKAMTVTWMYRFIPLASRIGVHLPSAPLKAWKKSHVAPQIAKKSFREGYIK